MSTCTLPTKLEYHTTVFVMNVLLIEIVFRKLEQVVDNLTHSTSKITFQSVYQILRHFYFRCCDYSCYYWYQHFDLIGVDHHLPCKPNKLPLTQENQLQLNLEDIDVRKTKETIIKFLNKILPEKDSSSPCSWDPECSSGVRLTLFSLPLYLLLKYII